MNLLTLLKLLTICSRPHLALLWCPAVLTLLTNKNPVAGILRVKRGLCIRVHNSISRSSVPPGAVRLRTIRTWKMEKIRFDLDVYMTALAGAPRGTPVG